MSKKIIVFYIKLLLQKVSQRFMIMVAFTALRKRDSVVHLVKSRDAVPINVGGWCCGSWKQASNITCHYYHINSLIFNNGTIKLRSFDRDIVGPPFGRHAITWLFH